MGQLLFVGICAIKYPLPLYLPLDEVLLNAFKDRELAHSIELPVQIRPLVSRDPIGGILRHFDFTCGTGKQIPPLSLINLVISLQYLYGQQEREEKLLLFEERSTHIFVKTIGEVVIHVL